MGPPSKAIDPAPTSASFERTDGYERLVGEQAVEADGDAVPDDEEEHDCEQCIPGVDAVPPERDDRPEQRGERRGHDQDRDRPFGSSYRSTFGPLFPPLVGGGDRPGREQKVSGHASSW